MWLLLLFAIFLWVIALYGKNKNISSFSKSKTNTLKAIMSLLIVGHHLSAAPQLSVLSSWGQPIVSVFLFVSGFGLAKQYSLKGQGYLDSFFSKRIWKVFLPCLVASLFFILFVSNIDVKRILIRFISEGNPPLPYSWYVYCIIVLYTFFWLSYRRIPEKWRIQSLFALTFMYVIFVYAFCKYEKFWFITAFAFPTGVSFEQFETGILNILRYRRRYAFVTFCMITFLAILILCETTYTDMLFFMFLPVTLVILLSRIVDYVSNSVLTRLLARISYEIYLVQGIAIVFFKDLVGMDYKSWSYILMVYAVTIIMAVFLKKVMTNLYL